MVGVVNKLANFVASNKSAILVGMASGGVILTAITAGESAIKAERTLRHMDYTWRHTPTQMERAKAVAPILIPVFITGTATILCMVCAHRIDIRTQIALGSALALTEASTNELTGALVKHVGKDKVDKAKKDLVEGKIEASEDILDLGKGEQLFWEPITGRAFKSTEGDIRGAFGQIASIMYGTDGASLNDFFDILGIDNADVGDVFGWNTGIDDPPEYSAWETRKIHGRSYLVLNLEFGKNVHMLRTVGC